MDGEGTRGSEGEEWGDQDGKEGGLRPGRGWWQQW